LNLVKYEPLEIALPDEVLNSGDVAEKSGQITDLIKKYKDERSIVESVVKMIESSDYHSISHYFRTRDCDVIPPSLSIAIANMNSSYWQKAMIITDVYKVMPQKRRDEWDKSIRENKTPDFTEDFVRSTIYDLFANRDMFYAERVRDLFDRLSRNHKTNKSEGFYKRMIFNYGLDYANTTWPSPNYSTAGYINDLRCVISKFLRRDEPNCSINLIKHCMKDYGKWFHIDAGSLKIRVYKKGTIHVEVHPELAWRINCILNEVSENSIPAKFRSQPEVGTKFKDFVLMSKPLNFQVLDNLSGAYNKFNNQHYLSSSMDKLVKKQVIEILELLGAKFTDNTYTFDYSNHDDVVDFVKVTGCVFDYKSYQYYPTPDNVAQIAQEELQCTSDNSLLEPSAGQGNLVKGIEYKSLDLVEISNINSMILERTNFFSTKTIHEMDFLKFAKNETRTFDRIIMNPPFSEGRVFSHIKNAFSLLNSGGRMVAIAPSSMIDKLSLDGATITYSGPFGNQFDNTSVSVVVITITKE